MDATTELAKFSPSDAAITAMATEYLPLVVNGINDKEGFRAVHEARMVVKGKRVEIEKTRKALKEDALRYGQRVDAEAKRLTALLAPIEEHLEKQEAAVAAEKERIAAEAEAKKRAALQARLDAFSALGVMANSMDIAALSDEEFAEELERAKGIAAEAKAKKDAEAATMAAYHEAVAAETARQAEVARAQEAEATRLREESARVAAAAEKLRRDAELEKAKAEAAERARVETEQRIAREEAARVAAVAAEVARLKAEDEQKPYREKLKAVATALHAIEVPAGPRSSEVLAVLFDAADKIAAIAKRKGSS